MFQASTESYFSKNTNPAAERTQAITVNIVSGAVRNGAERRMDITVNLFSEGQSHPADLGWNACVPIALYENIAAAIAATNEHSHPSQIGNCWLL